MPARLGQKPKPARLPNVIMHPFSTLFAIKIKDMTFPSEYRADCMNSMQDSGVVTASS